MLTEGKPARREDGLLDYIAQLKAKRDDTLKQIDIWAESDPALAEMLDDIRFHLL